MIPQQLLDDLRNSRRIIAVTHIHPDGDALGSLLAFAAVMESIGKEVFCLLAEPVSHLFEFLPGKERLSFDLEEARSFIRNGDDTPVGVALDCGDLARIPGDLYREIADLSPFVVIDHHASHQEFGTSRWVSVDRSSTGEMVYEIAEALGAEISYEAAYNLYVALVTDTGSFRYECTSARTLEVAGDLLRRGVRAEDVSGRVYDTFSPQRLRLLQQCLASVRLLNANRIAVMRVTRQMLADTGTLIDDVENFINIPRSVETVQVAVMLKEGENGCCSVSLRAKGGVDVSRIAGEFGGGGHHNAAGFRLDDTTLAEVEARLLRLLERAVL